jgi:23S rRNA pseudouridine1911/1915/1917 synthase
MSAERELRIVYRDDSLLVVEKPPGMVVHPAPGVSGRTVVDAVRGLAGGGEDPERPGIVHRLDRDTSGLMIVARTERAHRALAEQVHERRVERGYLALVEGRVGSRTGTIDAPLGRDHRAPERVTLGGRRPREARTHFEVIELLPADSLLAVRLETGRTHQIRVHMLSIGHPVCGDPTYGHAGRHGLERQFLHAASLRFRHPESGEELSFESPLPADLEEALERARVAS